MPDLSRRAAELAGGTLPRTARGDRYFDYCLEPYEPRRPPADKLRSESLLWAAFAHADAEACAPVVRTLREGLGRDMTVFGVKWDGQRLFYELYVYDPQREEPRASAAGLRAMLDGVYRLPEVRACPTMMVSFDLDPELAAAGGVDALNLYLTGTERHEGRSYLATERGLELDNLYRFLHPKREIDTVLSLLRSSAFLDYGAPILQQVLVPELFACKRVCVAKKRRRDGVYFSGIDVDQLLFFLRRFGYPAPLVRFVTEHGADLDHLYFDVGLDFEMSGPSNVRAVKTSFYGTF